MMGELRLPPLSQLFPGLYKFLYGPGGRKRVTVDNGAFSISTLVELAHTVLAEQRQVMHDFLKIFARPGLCRLAEIRAACHD